MNYLQLVIQKGNNKQGKRSGFHCSNQRQELSSSQMKKSKEFERLVAVIERVLHNRPNVKVWHNVKLKTKKGNERQIDILIEQTDRFVFRTIIECKDKKRRVEVKEISAFKTLIENVEAHQGIIVSSAGFQEGAMTEAKQEHILLYELKDFDQAAQDLESFLLNQFYVRLSHKNTSIQFESEESFNGEINLFTPLTVEGNPIQLTIAKVIQADYEKKRDEVVHEFTKNVKPVKDMIAITDGTITCEILFNKVPVYYVSNGRRTRILGFTSQLSAVVELAPVALDSVKQYRDVKEDVDKAYVFEFQIGDIQHVFITSNVPA